MIYGRPLKQIAIQFRYSVWKWFFRIISIALMTCTNIRNWPVIATFPNISVLLGPLMVWAMGRRIWHSEMRWSHTSLRMCTCHYCAMDSSSASIYSGSRFQQISWSETVILQDYKLIRPTNMNLYVDWVFMLVDIVAFVEHFFLWKHKSSHYFEATLLHAYLTFSRQTSKFHWCPEISMELYNEDTGKLVFHNSFLNSK